MRRVRAANATGLTVLAVLALLGCTGEAARDDTPGKRVVRRDSAGIAIVESDRPRWRLTEGWRVDTTPLLDLTRSGAGATHEFTRVVGAHRLSDGAIAVADRGTFQVRLYAPSGRFRWALGRDGEGPGEFRRLASLARFGGDSLAAFDTRLGRATIITPAGQVGRTVYPYPPGSGVEDLQVCDDSTFVVQVWSYKQMRGSAGLVRIPATIATVTSTGAVDTLTTIPGYETFVIPEGGDMRPLFNHTSHVASAGGRVHVGSAERLEFAVYAPTRRLERIVRVPAYDLRLSPQEIQRERDALVGASPHPVVQRIVANLPRPVTRPAYAQLVVDVTGAVWTAGFRARSDTVGLTPWQVFGPDGEWLGATELPRRLQVFEIGHDYVLGVQLDSLDVEHVQVLRLRRIPQKE